MARFKYKGRGTVSANGYIFIANEITEVRDDDAETLTKLRGSRGGSPHPSFEEVVSWVEL